MKHLLIIALICGAAQMFHACSSDEKASEAIELVTVGSRLPSFNVVLNDDTHVTPMTLRGHRAVIVFFNTGCSDCRAYLPKLNEFYEQIRSSTTSNLSDVRVVAVSRAQKNDAVARYWNEYHYTVPYSAQTDRTVYNLFAKIGIPRTYIVNERGIVTATFDPDHAPNPLQLQEALRKAK